MTKNKKVTKTAAKKKGINSIPARRLKELYETILRIRRFEEKIIEVYPVQDMKTPVHLCIGEEAIAAGVCIHLRKDDYIFSTHRSHGHCIAKGSDMKRMMAEFYGKKQAAPKERVALCTFATLKMAYWVQLLLLEESPLLLVLRLLLS